MRPTATSLLVCLCAWLSALAPAAGKIIEQCTEDIAQAHKAEDGKGGAANNQLTNAGEPVGARRSAFKHRVTNRGERSELAMRKTEIGGTYWYGWSLLLPENFDHTGSSTIVMQLASYPTKRNGKFPCSANGPFIHVDPDGKLVFHLQHAGDDRDMVCDHFTLAEDVRPLKGKWLDFVMHAKWTGDKDCFCKVWLKVHDNDFVQTMNYTGRTWWNDEDQGPYFKMGLYTGEPGWKGPAERTLYTAEYRLGDADSSFDEVAPGQPAASPDQPAAKPRDPRAARPASADRAEIRQWSPHEIVLTAEREYANPYLDVDLVATFTGPGMKLTVRGFWDGGRTYRIRFTPPTKGQWTYRAQAKPADGGLASRGQFEARGPKSESHGFLRRDERWPTSFVFDDGTRHFMWGTTYYHLLLNARAGDRWQEAIDGAQRYGMTKARISLAPSDPDTKGGKSGQYDRSEPFQGGDHSRLDLAHWQAADRAIEYMHGRGFQADLILFWRKTKTSPDIRAQDERYLRYALARYGAYTNVIWCVVNEWNYSSIPQSEWNHLGQLVRDEDPWSKDGGLLRAHSIHQQTRPDWNFTDQAWPSHAILQLGVRNRGTSARIGDEWAAAGKAGTRFRHGDEWGNHSIVRNWTGKYPVVNDEYGYIGEPQDDSEPKRDGQFVAITREKHRHAMWGIAAGGGYGAAGDKNDYPGDGRPYFSANWHDTPEYGDISNLAQFFTERGIEYWRMAPHNELATGERTYVLAEPGRQYVLYAAAGGTPALDVAAGEYAAWRYDPRTGKAEELPEVAGPGKASWKLPDEQDWVIHVARKNSDLKQAKQ